MLAERLASNTFQGWHTRLEYVIQRITPSVPIHEAIYSWRNEVLHGEDFVSTKNRVVLNIAILFLLEKCRDDYVALADIARNVEQ